MSKDNDQNQNPEAYKVSNDPQKELATFIAPAIEILKETLKRAQDRQKKQSEIEAGEAAARAEHTGIQEAPMPATGMMYVSIDGDNIGNAVARAENKDDEKTLAQVSDRIEAGEEAFKNWVIGVGGVVIEAGGDEGLGKVPAMSIEKVQDLKTRYESAVGATVTIGVGNKISEATKARTLGKLRGKNTTVFWDESCEKELKIRLEMDDEGSESQKVKDAGLADEAPEQPAPPSRTSIKHAVQHDQQDEAGELAESGPQEPEQSMESQAEPEEPVAQETSEEAQEDPAHDHRGTEEAEQDLDEAERDNPYAYDHSEDGIYDLPPEILLQALEYLKQKLGTLPQNLLEIPEQDMLEALRSIPREV